MTKDWTRVNGRGQPITQTVSDCVVTDIREGNLSAAVDVRVSALAWEAFLRCLDSNRPIEFEKVENKAAIVTYVCGRKTRIFPDDQMQGYDIADYRSAQG